MPRRACPTQRAGSNGRMHQRRSGWAIDLIRPGRGSMISHGRVLAGGPPAVSPEAVAGRSASAVAGGKAAVAFPSHCPLDPRAGETDAVELPVAHRMKLNDRRPLDLSDEVGRPPCLQGGNEAIAPRPSPEGSGR